MQCCFIITNKKRWVLLKCFKDKYPVGFALRGGRFMPFGQGIFHLLYPLLPTSKFVNLKYWPFIIGSNQYRCIIVTCSKNVQRKRPKGWWMMPSILKYFLPSGTMVVVKMECWLAISSKVKVIHNNN